MNDVGQAWEWGATYLLVQQYEPVAKSDWYDIISTCTYT